MSESIFVLLRRHWLAIVLGLVVGIAALELMFHFLPDRLGTQSILPYEGGLWLGLMVGFAVAARRSRIARSGLAWAGIVGGLCVVLLVAVAIPLSPNVISGKTADVGKCICTGIGLFVWILAYIIERRGQIQKPVFTAVLLGLALAAFNFENGRDLQRALAGERVQTWNVYHYYMGSKYFPELGYHYLYAAHIAADNEWIASRPDKKKGKRDYSMITRSRSMKTYDLMARDDLAATFDRSVFTDERWDEFGKDLRLMRPLYPKKKWRKVVQDLGYNPAPPWTIVGRTVTEVVTIEGRGWWFLKNSDLPFFLAAALAMWWAFGLRRTAAAILFVSAFPVNNGFFAGAFLRYEWLNLAIISVALYHKGWFRSSGVALSWAAMTRVFPGFLVFPILFKLAVCLVRRGPAAERQRYLRFTAAFCAACTVLFIGSHFTGRGTHTWLEWKEDLTLHSKMHPVTSSKRVGVPRLALHNPTKHRFWALERGSRPAQLENSANRKHIIQAAGFVLLLLALFRRRDLDGMLMMLMGVFLLVTISRYYASIWMILFFLGARKPRDAIPWSALWAGSMLLLIVTTYYAAGTTSANYLLLNYNAALMFVVLCLGFLIETWREYRRSRRVPGVGDAEVS